MLNAILGTPTLIFVGFPVFIFLAVTVSEAAKHGWQNIQWKYPVFFGGASAVIITLISILSDL